MKKIFILPLVFIPGFAFADIASTKYVDDVVNSLNIPAAVTEQTVSGWGFTKNAGTVTKVNNVDPVNGNVTLTIPTVTDTYDATSSSGMSGKAVASAISTKVSIPNGGSAGQVLKKQSDGSIAWANDIDTDTDTTYTAGTGISISGTMITNTAISQVRSGGSSSSTLANIWLE